MPKFALCSEMRDCEDLEKGKGCKILPDEAAAQAGYLRVVDESGEDSLYSESSVVFVALPQRAQKALTAHR